MMKIQSGIKQFFEGLGSRIKVSRVNSELERQYAETSGTIMGIIPMMIDGSFSDAAITKLVMGKYPPFKQDGIIKAIHNTTVKIMDDQKEVERMIKAYLDSVIIKSELDNAGLNVLYYINAISFFNMYTLALLNTMVAEVREKDGYKVRASDKFLREVAYEKKNIDAYGIVMNIMNRPLAELGKSIDKIRGIQVIADMSDVAMGLEPGATDPMRTGFLPVWANPVFHAADIWNSWVVLQHTKNKELVASLRLKLMILEQERVGAVDEAQKSKIEREIEYHNGRLAKAISKIRDIEESV